jgi:hypothetical protein
MRIFLWLVCAALALDANLASSTTYTYSGPMFAVASGVYTTSMRITGSFTTAAALPSNMPLTNIGPNGGSDLVLSWSFFDGVNTYSNANSVLIYEQPGFFAVSTDASGGILSFSIGLMFPVPPNTAGQPMNAIVFNPVVTEATTANPCTIVTAGICTSIPATGVNIARASNCSGTCSGWQVQPSASGSIPTLSESTLILLVLSIAWLAGSTLRHRV